MNKFASKNSRQAYYCWDKQPTPAKVQHTLILNLIRGTVSIILRHQLLKWGKLIIIIITAINILNLHMTKYPQAHA